MKFLCLAYGDEDGWSALSKAEQRAALARDEVIRDRGDLVSAVETKVTSIKNWDGELEVSEETYANHLLPLAGFSVIEADSLEEAIELLADTPCARAGGYIEIRALLEVDE